MLTPSENSPLVQAQAAFAEAGLPWPPMPETLAAQLQRAAPWVFASRELPASPYALAPFVQELIEQPAVPDYAVAALDGYGTNSWAAHFFLVQGPLAVFIQEPWGGAYTDTEAQRPQVERLFDWAGRLPGQVQACQAEGRIPTGWRLVVVAAQAFDRATWAWVPPPASRNRLRWRDASNLLASVDEELAALRSGLRLPE